MRTFLWGLWLCSMANCLIAQTSIDSSQTNPTFSSSYQKIKKWPIYWESGISMSKNSHDNNLGTLGVYSRLVVARMIGRRLSLGAGIGHLNFKYFIQGLDPQGQERDGQASYMFVLTEAVANYRFLLSKVSPIVTISSGYGFGVGDWQTVQINGGFTGRGAVGLRIARKRGTAFYTTVGYVLQYFSVLQLLSGLRVDRYWGSADGLHSRLLFTIGFQL